MAVLIGGLVVALVVFVAALTRLNTSTVPQPTNGSTNAPGPSTSSRTPSATPSAEGPYQNENYTAPPPDLDPPDLVYAANEAEAKKYLTRNALYQQQAPRPIRCQLSTIARNAPAAKLQQHLDQLTACLMKEWAGVLTAAGYVAVRPKVTLYSSTIRTACGRMTTRNAFYCGGDQRVYFATDLGQVMAPEFKASRLPVDVILAHEFGHAIQARVGILGSQVLLNRRLTKSQALTLNRRVELQADCFAGLYLGSVAQSMALTTAEKATIPALFHSFGDDVLSRNKNIVGDHGLGRSRQYWGTLGYQADSGSLAVCNTFVAPESRVR